MMGLIEKAAGAFDAAYQRPDETRQADAPSARERFFDIDFTSLAAQGFYAPSERSSRLALELRAIKRGLLRRIGFRNASGDPKMVRKGGRQRNLVLVTSTRPGEGKTFTAINLALSLACEEGMETLLVDADAPRPKIRAHFGFEEGKGLLDRIADPRLPVEALCRRANQAPLSILAEGNRVERPAELYGSAEAQRVFTQLSMASPGRIIIVDAPPVLATTEAIILARHVDEVIFVVQSDSTPEAGVAAALDDLLEANPNVSLVLNRCLIGPGGSYYGSYGDYDRPPAGASQEATHERPGT